MGIEILKLEEDIIKKELELLKKQLEIEKAKEKIPSVPPSGYEKGANLEEVGKIKITFSEKVSVARKRAYMRAYNKGHKSKYYNDNAIKEKDYLDGNLSEEDYIFWLDNYDRENSMKGGTVAKGITRNPFSQTKIVKKETPKAVSTYTYDGKTLTVEEWAKEVEMSKNILQLRLDDGMPFEEAITTPC